jgi:hypothetical protein
MEGFDGEGDVFGGLRPLIVPPSHLVLREGHLCVETEVKVMPWLLPWRTRPLRLPRDPWEVVMLLGSLYVARHVVEKRGLSTG